MSSYKDIDDIDRAENVWSYCQNCHRGCFVKDEVNEMDCYVVDLKLYKLKDSGVSCWGFCNMRARDYVRSDGVMDSIMLCCLCRCCVQCHERNEKPGVHLVWAAMVWKWFVKLRCDRQAAIALWSYLPRKWRSWWVAEIAIHFPEFNVSINSPASIVADVTCAKRELEVAIEELTLVKLMKAVDEHMYPLVKCPFGCTEYYHKAGTIAFDVIIAWFLQAENLPMNSSKVLLKRLRGAWSDFLDAHIASTEYFVWNPDWKVCPSVAFVEADGVEVPIFLTCCNHNGGCKKQYLHPPCAASSKLPSCEADQLAPSVIIPRTIRLL